MHGSRLLRAWPFALVALLAVTLAGGVFDDWAWVPAVGIVLVGLAAAFLPGPEPRRRRRRRRSTARSGSHGRRRPTVRARR
ncbi:hypothetical protein [Sanguibacter sp. 25GB23B1]|uniref:hypothetical protein n=1 Tax=unclassified Sanguibacter TaxID=2645534 RepID=UPI0032AEE51C